MSEHAIDLGKLPVIELGDIAGEEESFARLIIRLPQEQAEELRAAMCCHDPLVTMRLSWHCEDDDGQ